MSEILRLIGPDGRCAEADYLSLDSNQMFEFTDGIVEVLTMPTPGHQRIVRDLLIAIDKFVRPQRLGEVLNAPLPVRIAPHTYREPDIILMLKQHSAMKCEKYWDGADLLVEVVSDDSISHQRDHVQKRTEYAEAGIPEYWIVDPQERKIIVLVLHRGEYLVHGEFTSGGRADSILLAGFAVDVDAVFPATQAE
jgi:Uma2 family endonuclease